MAGMGVGLLIVASMCCFMIGSTTAMLHVVGGKEGWDVPPNVTFYEDWAKPRTFGAGDQLIFPYSAGSNNVVVVNQKDYETCFTQKPITTYYMGPTVLNLTQTGDFYYITNVGRHCEFGQKLHITVVNAKGSSGSTSPLVFDFLDDAPAPAPTATASTPAPSAANAVQNVRAVSLAGLAFVLCLLIRGMNHLE